MASKLAFVADIHIANHKRLGGPIVSGINQRARLILDALGRAIDEANARDCDAFIVLGDLFDHHKPSPQLLSAVQKLLEKAPSPILLVGNHDVASAEPGDHALGPLDPVAQIVDRPTVERLQGVDLILLPFHPDPGDSYAPRALEEVARPLGPMETLVPGRRGGQEIRPVERPRRVVGLHLGIRDDVLPEYLRTSPDSIDLTLLTAEMRRAGVEAAFAGNWHERKDWTVGEERVYQVSALVPTGWDNPGVEHYGWMSIFDAGTGKVEQVQIHGPRFLSVVPDFLLPDLPHLFIEWKVPPDQLEAAGDRLREMEGLRQIVAGSAVPDARIAEQKARTAALEARSEESIAGAVEAYVAEMDIPAGVERREVFDVVQAALAGKPLYQATEAETREG